MPIYDYSCRECGGVSEVLVRALEGNARYPHCGSEDIEKLVSASYSIKMDKAEPGATCCGREERCETPPCSSGNTCGKSIKEDMNAVRGRNPGSLKRDTCARYST